MAKHRAYSTTVHFEFSYLPLWLVKYDGFIDLPTVNFGGWTVSSAKQYVENTLIAGIEVELDVADRSVFSGPDPLYIFPPPHLRFTSIAQGLLILDWCDEDLGYILEYSEGPLDAWTPGRRGLFFRLKNQ